MSMPYFCGGKNKAPSKGWLTHPSGNAVLAFEPLEELIRIGIVLAELLDNILAHIAVVLFDA